MNWNDRKQGVLWKRRDIFKNRWRPRWFDLQPQQGLLTYYLLTTEPTTAITSSATANSPSVTTPPLVGTSNHATTRTEPIVRRRLSNNNINNNAPITTTTTTTTPRNRTTSWESHVSENTIDYDVVPRGTIYLLGCTVKPNDALLSREENVYAFTIYPPNANETVIHLAARSPQARAAWIEKIAIGCRGGVVAEREREQEGTREHENDQQLDEEPVHQEVVDGTTSSSPTGTSASCWKSLGQPSELYADLPESLADRIQAELETNLAMLCSDGDDDNDDNPDPADWKTLYRRDDGSAAFQRKQYAPPPHAPMIKSVALLPHHSPMQVFNLLIDSSRRKDFETNIRRNERIKVLNPHTFLDYYSYNATWPTSCREFTVAVHWQVMAKRCHSSSTIKKAIVIVSFSCPEADVLCAPTAGHVRATLHVNVSLLQQRPVGCHLTRLLSFDLAGGMSLHLSNIMISQQAGLPGIIKEFLQRHEPVIREEEDSSRWKGPLTNENLIQNVINRLGEKRDDSLKRRLNFDVAKESSLVLPDDSLERSTGLVGKDNVPPVQTQTVLLLAPVLVHRLATLLAIPGGALFWFLLSVFLAIRQVVLLHIGEVVSNKYDDDADQQQLVGPVTCRFRVDLKGILRFIANKEDERQELNIGSSEVTVEHILASALARALKREERLHVSRVRIPWLLIDELVQCDSSSPISVTISAKDSSRVVTLQNVDTSSIQGIADQMKEELEHKNSDQEAPEIGQCLVLATPNYDQVDMETDAIPTHPNLQVVAVIGGVRLERSTQRSGGGFTTAARATRPVLSVSLTFARSHHQASFVSCRRFAEEVQKLLQFPEICED